MATRSQKAKVGVFLVINVAIVGGGAVLISGWQGKEEIPYTVVFEGSILGLNEGGLVHYMGKDVGRVTTIWVGEEDNLAHVGILIDPEKITLREGLEAKLEYFTIATGTMCIGLKGGEGPPLEPGAVITAAPSVFESATTRINELADRIEAEIDRLSKAFDGLEEGQFTRIVEKVDGILEEVDTAMEGMEEGELAQTMDHVNAILAKVDSGLEGLEEGEFARTAENINAILDQVRTGLEGMEEQQLAVLLADAGGVVKRVRTMLETMDDNEFAETVARIRDLIESGETFLEETTEAVNDASERLLHDADNIQHGVTDSLDALNDALKTIETTVENLDEDPSALVRGKSKPRRRDTERKKD